MDTKKIDKHNGYVSIYRKLIYDPSLWLSEKFTRGQAWVDLLLLANHSPGTLFIRGNEVVIDRGQVGWSEESLATRWGWSRMKVRRFKRWLKGNDRIDYRTAKSETERDNRINNTNSHILSVITICNYDAYQQTEQQTIQQTIQQKNNRRYTNNKNNKNNKNISAANDSSDFVSETRNTIDAHEVNKEIMAMAESQVADRIAAGEKIRNKIAVTKLVYNDLLEQRRIHNEEAEKINSQLPEHLQVLFKKHGN